MIIALINWRIFPSKTDAFILKWKTGLSLNSAAGLIGEFLSKVEDASFFEGVTWEMEPDEKDTKDDWRSQIHVSYVNVGIWNSTDAFIQAVGYDRWPCNQRGIRGGAEAACDPYPGTLAARLTKLADQHLRWSHSLDD